MLLLYGVKQAIASLPVGAGSTELQLVPGQLPSNFQYILFCVTGCNMSPDIPPESTLPYPPIHKDKKFVVLSDW